MTDTSKDFTEQQQLFLDLLFNKYGGDVKKAAHGAGYEKPSVVLRSQKVRDKVVELAERIISLHSAKAAVRLVEGLDSDGTDPGQLTKLNSAREVLDRAGLGKKDRVDINVTAPNGIFLLPPKRDDNEVGASTS